MCPTSVARYSEQSCSQMVAWEVSVDLPSLLRYSAKGGLCHAVPERGVEVRVQSKRQTQIPPKSPYQKRTKEKRGGRRAFCVWQAPPVTLDAPRLSSHKC